MNYSLFRASDNYTAVSVNHRALITRTLTKYPVDYALFRELLQNSADAKAKSAVITFESQNAIDTSNPTTLHSATITKLVFRNNGLVFSDDDWNRLKEIAKGNPDETKIGAFGVGFYSVFELTDTPLVHSGNWVMSFHFVGDELRYSKSKSDEYVDGTLIDIPYRKKDANLPDLIKFISFITQSFMLISLNQVTLQVTTEATTTPLKLFEITKVESPPKQMQIPPKLNPYSFNKVFCLRPPTISQLQVDISYLNATQMKKADLSSAAGLFSFGKKMVSSLFTSSEDPTDTTKLVCYLHRIDATADVKVSNDFKKRMVETVLKPPAKQSTMSLLTFNKHDMEKSTLKAPLSDCVFPVEYNDAKLVIGFPTKQSTGIKTHIALNQLIPTMERTAVDMSNATVKDWNSELLYAAGILARCVYEHELETASKQSVEQQLSYASYTMKRFEMSSSAPDASVGQRFAAGFWRSLNVVAVPTQLGIQPSTKARLAGDTPMALIRHTPVLTTDNNSTFIDQIKEAGYVKQLSMTDLAQDLQMSPINATLFHELIKWLPRTAQVATIANAIVVTDEGIDGLIVGKIKYYQSSGSSIPDDMPIPDNCLPRKLAAQHTPQDLQKFGWRELPYSVWLQHIIQLSKKSGPQNIVTNSQFACSVLSILSSAWVRLVGVEKDAIIDLLEPVSCIPTQLGMQKPSDSYLRHIPLFPNLPVIDESVQASKSFLMAINVRESVDMKFVLKVLHDPNSTLTWSSEDLVNYLNEHRSSLLNSDWQLLRNGLFFQDTQSNSLVSVGTLYAPHDTLAALGFHTLKWKTQWKSSSPEAQLLYKIGLKKAPSAIALFEQAIKKNNIKPALEYYLANFEDNKYSSTDVAACNYKIIPTMNGGLVAPKNCFYDKEASLFGLEVISRKYQEYQAQRLGVQVKPPVSMLLDSLLSKPQKDSDNLFAYLSTRIASFTQSDVARCKGQKFIPVKNGFESPENVFFSGVDPQLNSLFNIIKPGEQSTPFLRKIGVQEFPSIKQIAWRTVNDPAQVYEAFGNSTSYKQLLFKFENEWSSLKSDKALVTAMKSSKFLVGETWAEDAEKASIGLYSAPEISLVDNVIILNQFKHLIIACPQENFLEDLSHRLGSSTLSSSLMERAVMGKPLEYSGAEEVIQVIRDRLVLFIESTSKEASIRSSQVQKIKFVFVSDIKLDRKLKNTSVISQSTSAYMPPSEANTLYLTPNPDWFQVSGVLARYVLKRPDPESVIVLELQLSSSLESLQRKGYNVNRLLKRQREIEDAKYLEQVRQENLKKQQMEEQLQKMERENEELERHRAAQEAAAAEARAERLKHAAMQEERKITPSQPKMPYETPASTNSAKNDTKNDGLPSMAGANLGAAKGFLSSLLKSKDSSKKRDPLLNQGSAPEQPKLPVPPQQQPQQQQSGGQINKPDPQVLRNGISTSRPFSRDNLDAAKHQDTPDAPMPVSCEPKTVYDYKVAAKLNDGIKIFVKSNGPPATEQQMEFAYEFRPILRTCAEVYNVRWDSVSMFIGELESIAFNTGGSLFFNLEVFISNVASGFDKSKQLDFWFTVMAHELAHNLVSSHGAKHSYYTEFYIHEYMSKLRALQ